MTTTVAAQSTAGVAKTWGLGGVEAPNPKVAALITEASGIIWSQDDRQYSRAARMLQDAMNASPGGHGIRVICLKRLAKIARMEGNFDLAHERLFSAYVIAKVAFGPGHSQTLRVLEKKACVCETAHAWYPKGHEKGNQQGVGLIPAPLRKPLAPMVEAVYVTPLTDIDTAGPETYPGLANLMRADMNFAMKRYEEAHALYRLASQELPRDDSNHERMRERFQKCREQMY